MPTDKTPREIAEKHASERYPGISTAARIYGNTGKTSDWQRGRILLADAIEAGIRADRKQRGKS
ncbi:MAG: hypothetical protein ABFD89_04720 [Bryobacteraceae bacterium]